MKCYIHLNSLKEPQAGGSSWAEKVDTSDVHFPLPLFPQGGEFRGVESSHLKLVWKYIINKHLQCSLGKTKMRTIINLMATLSIMISRKCLNSILQDAAGNKKTEHADTSFLECFSTLKQGCGDKNGSLIIYYKAYAKGPWIDIAQEVLIM